MSTIEISEIADWKYFESVAQVLEEGLGGYWKEKLDGLDQRYWDLAVDDQTLTLHFEHYLGISVFVPDNADETAQRVRMLLNESDEHDDRGTECFS